MRMEIFRISKSKYSRKLVSSGIQNRWNLDGQYVIYASSSRSLATLESIVHRGAIVPSGDFKVLVLSIADNDELVRQVIQKSLPKDWRSVAAYPDLQKIGADWYEQQESLILKVPSAVIPMEHNYIINTDHPDFKKHVKLVRREPYFWDDRL